MSSKMDESRDCRRNVNLYDVYAGYQYLHLYDEEEAREGPATVPKALDEGLCISSITLAELEYAACRYWEVLVHPAQLQYDQGQRS